MSHDVHRWARSFLAALAAAAHSRSAASGDITEPSLGGGHLNILRSKPSISTATAASLTPRSHDRGRSNGQPMLTLPRIVPRGMGGGFPNSVEAVQVMRIDAWLGVHSVNE